jgi:peptide/nickel transport system substrate-binding protein/microcin C transport system substrate-binding protein
LVLGASVATILVAGALNAAEKKTETIPYAHANPAAPIGGSITMNMQAEPPSVHPILSQDYYSEIVKGYVLDSLLANDLNTYDWVPRLAEKWEISKDKKVFIFHLRKDATFHDGHPLTAEDVKFSFDAIFDPSYKASHMRPYYESIDKVEVVDPFTVKVTAKDTYFLNFSVVASMYIIPKHIYSDVEKSSKMTRILVGSGPYTLDQFEKGQKLVLKRFDKWYGFSLDPWKGYYNFAQRIYRFIKEDNVALEMLKKGDLDFVEILSPEVYTQKTEGDPWGKTIFKNQIENAYPKNYFYVGFNFRKDLFKDKNVRLALAHLMNREEMNKRFRYGMSLLATGPEYVQSDYASANTKPITYDPAKALELLNKSGWKDPEKKGILQKTINGKVQEFRFTLIHSSKDREKYWTMYREDLKKVGIDMDIRLLEWNPFVKLLDDGNFDAMAMGWGGTIEWDPRQIWHSSSLAPGGSNFIAYKNSDVDKLIDKARNEIDRSKRVQMLHKVYDSIAADVPYIFMFNDRYYLYANSNKIVKPTSAPAMKYDVGTDIWWSAKP